jgi:hypothetical protein
MNQPTSPPPSAGGSSAPTSSSPPPGATPASNKRARKPCSNCINSKVACDQQRPCGRCILLILLFLVCFFITVYPFHHPLSFLTRSSPISSPEPHTLVLSVNSNRHFNHTLDLVLTCYFFIVSMIVYFIFIVVIKCAAIVCLFVVFVMISFV